MNKKETENNNLGMFLCSLLLFFSLFVVRNLMEMNIKFQMQVSWGWIVGISIVISILHLIMHELGHCIVFKYHHISIQAIFLMLFVLVKVDGKWKIKLCNSQQFLMGGMVVPKLPIIKSEEEYQNVKQAYVKELLGGPIATMLFTVIGVGGLCVLSTICTDMKTECRLLSLVTAALGFGFLLMTCRKNSTDLGDLYAYQQMKQDTFWSNQVMIQDEQLSNVESSYMDSYCVKRADKFWDSTNQTNNLDTDIFSFMTIVLQRAIASKQYQLTAVQEKVLNDIVATNDWLEHLEDETIELFGYRLVQYSVVCKHDKAFASQIYNSIMENIRYKKEYSEFLQCECEQVIGMRDAQEYLYDRSKIKTSSDWKIWSVLEEYYKEEERILSRLCDVEVI